MSQRHADLMWLRDALERLSLYQQQMEWAEDSDSIHYLTEAMLRDLDQCRRLCRNLHRQAEWQGVS